MLIVRLHHGLGNQMFQYAYARATSARIGTPFKLDLEWFRRAGGQRKYLLDHLRIEEEHATPPEVSGILGTDRPIALRLLRAVGSRIGLNRRRYLREDLSRFNDGLLKPTLPAYVHGFFTDEGYFRDAGPQVRHDLGFRTPPSARNQTTLDFLRSTESVAVHIRRGDFQDNPVYEVCTPEYYRAALARVGSLLTAQPQFVFFSDSPEAARDYLSLQPGSLLVDWNREEPHEDLRLMAACKHRVLSNSTLAWWAAWLAEGRDGITIAPLHWLNQAALRLPRYESFVRDWCSDGTVATAGLYKSHWRLIANIGVGRSSH